MVRSNYTEIVTAQMKTPILDIRYCQLINKYKNMTNFSVCVFQHELFFPVGVSLPACAQHQFILRCRIQVGGIWVIPC